MKLLLIFLLFISSLSQAAPKKVLVVLSSENKITLKGGVVHPTGVFLSELTVPLKVLVDADFEPVFANPRGNEPSVDTISESAVWFGGSEQRFQEMRLFLGAMPGFRHPLRLAEVRRQDLDEYSGIFVPGGHAPMEDLSHDQDLGVLLRYFHAAKKPTALICHGPIALLSALPDASDFTDALGEGRQPKVLPWIYGGYSMTSFSTPEEMQEEPGQDNALGGFVKFYPDQALSTAGGRIVVANKWQSHVVRDRELITGQNPMSDIEFAHALLSALLEPTGN